MILDPEKPKPTILHLRKKKLMKINGITLFHPTQTFRQKKVKDFYAVPLLTPIFQQGKLVYDLPSLDEIRAHHQSQISLFWEEYLRLLNPEEYPVDLSLELWNKKTNLLRSIYKQIRKENGEKKC